MAATAPPSVFRTLVSDFYALCIGSCTWNSRRVTPHAVKPTEIATQTTALQTRIFAAIPGFIPALSQIVAEYIPPIAQDMRECLQLAAQSSLEVPTWKKHYCLPMPFLLRLNSFRECPHAIDLSEMPLNEHILQQIAFSCPHATALHLRGCGLTIELIGATGGLEEILKLHDLETLDLSDNTLVATADRDEDQDEATDASPSSFFQFRALPRLRTLSLCHVFDLDTDSTLLVADLGFFTELTVLDLSRNKRVGTADQIKVFADMPALERLILLDCPDVQPAFINGLRARRPMLAIITEREPLPRTA